MNGKLSKVLRWGAIGLLVLGTAALLLVRTVWAVPMALLSPDPRLVGTALVGVGLLTAVLTMSSVAGGRRGPGRQIVLPALATVAVVALAWTYTTSEFTLEEVVFRNEPASLQGTLVLPNGAGPHPAVVFMHGSGPERRGVSFHFADHFARAGVAALIYDKRGAGGSIGGHPRDPYPDLAGDAVAAVRHLQQHPSIDPDRIGLWGISEGGWTAPLAASMIPDEVAFLLVVSGGGAAPEDEELYSIRTHLEDQDISATGIEQALDLRRRINQYYRSGEGREPLLASIRQVEDSDWFTAADWYLPPASQVYQHGSDEWQYHMTFLDFDALPLLRGLEMPMLFIHGGKDRSYPTELSVNRLQELNSDPDRDMTVVTYPGADHGIMTRQLPWPRYADGYIEHTVSWVVNKVGNEPASG